MNRIYTTSRVASHPLGVGHKEPFAATIANNEEDKDDDENDNDLKSKMIMLHAILLITAAYTYSLRV